MKNKIKKAPDGLLPIGGGNLEQVGNRLADSTGEGDGNAGLEVEEVLGGHTGHAGGNLGTALVLEAGDDDRVNRPAVVGVVGTGGESHTGVLLFDESLVHFMHPGGTAHIQLLLGEGAGQPQLGVGQGADLLLNILAHRIVLLVLHIIISFLVRGQPCGATLCL